MEDRYSPTRSYRPRRAPRTVEDRDACALYASVSKRALPAHEPIEHALTALERMLHRAGDVDGEGDGCGLQLDVPRALWAEDRQCRRSFFKSHRRTFARAGRPWLSP